MPCFHPLRGYRAPFPDPKTGKYRIVGIKARSAEVAVLPGCCAVDLPCGQCIGCRLERSRKWAVRCVQESQLHAENCFLTLTYDDDHLPYGGTLVKRDFQLFMKRLRKEVAKDDKRIRFFACGEYGENLSRPHYHACVFGFEPADKVIWKVREGVPLFRSALVERLWPYGFSTVGQVTFESAAYVARYVTKKVTGEPAKAHYTYMVPETGELIERQPEYVDMSRRPGIAREWYARYRDDVYPHDEVIARGVPMKPPRYYDKIYDVEHPERMQALREKRAEAMSKSLGECSLSRLQVREKVALSKVKLLKRGVEDAS